MTTKHTLSCPVCGNQKGVIIPARRRDTVRFSCCKSWLVEIAVVRNANLTTDIAETWHPYKPVPVIPRHGGMKEWTIEQGKDGYFELINEYGEPLVKECYAQFKNAEKRLAEIIAEEIDNYDGPDVDPTEGVGYCDNH